MYLRRQCTCVVDSEVKMSRNRMTMLVVCVVLLNLLTVVNCRSNDDSDTYIRDVTYQGLLKSAML